MKYMLLIYQGTALDGWESLPDSEKQAIGAAYGAITATSGVTAGQQMHPPAAATTVRVEDGRTLTTDGPFVEAKEAIGGWLIYEADDLDAAIALAARIPAARLGGAIEIRPVQEY
jgi:hypothetical protein